ncbi:MAG: hypothetical protein ABIP71_02170 [Verrucomicrobiota bacterium]
MTVDPLPIATKQAAEMECVNKVSPELKLRGLVAIFLSAKHENE